MMTTIYFYSLTTFIIFSKSLIYNQNSYYSFQLTKTYLIFISTQNIYLSSSTSKTLNTPHYHPFYYCHNLYLTNPHYTSPSWISPLALSILFCYYYYISAYLYSPSLTPNVTHCHSYSHHTHYQFIIIIITINIYTI